jgi:hypothetical protein
MDYTRQQARSEAVLLNTMRLSGTKNSYAGSIGAEVRTL